MKILGIYDYSLPKRVWTDKGTSLSWVRAFEELAKEGHEMHALLPEETSDGEEIVDGIHYHYIKVNSLLRHWNKKIDEISADVVMLNVFPCSFGMEIAPYIHQKSKIILRFHTQPNIALRTGTAILEYTNSVIVPLDIHQKELESIYKYKRPIYIVPFGSELDIFKNQNKTRDLDFISSCAIGKHKGGQIVEDVFNILTSRGYKTKNVIWINRKLLPDWFNRGKVFYYPSLVEASGSRVMIEAIACGVLPVVDVNSPTCAYVADQIGGYKIDAQIKADLYGISDYGKNPNEIADELEAIYKREANNYSRINPTFIKQFAYSEEVNRLIEVLKSFIISVN